MRRSFRGAWFLVLCIAACGGSTSPGDGGGNPDAPCGTLDCSALDGACHFGVCDPAAGQCVAAPRVSGTACDDGNPCTSTDACAAGVCTGAPMDGVSCVLEGEECATAASCVAGVCVGTFVPETTCATARTVPIQDGTVRIDGALACSNAQDEASCGGAGSERYYRLVLEAPRRVRLSSAGVPGGATGLVLALRETCEASTSELACSASVLEASLSPGEHTLVVDSGSGGHGSFAIDVDVLEPDGCAEEPDIAIPARAGDVTHVRGDTTGEGVGEFPTHFCNPTSSPDHVYRFVLTETSKLRFRGESGTTFDAYLTLLSGTCASPTAIGCDDDSAGGGLPELVSTLPPGEYHLVVTGVYTSNAGPYDISITRL